MTVEGDDHQAKKREEKAARGERTKITALVAVQGRPQSQIVQTDPKVPKGQGAARTGASHD